MAKHHIYSSFLAKGPMYGVLWKYRMLYIYLITKWNVVDIRLLFCPCFSICHLVKGTDQLIMYIVPDMKIDMCLLCTYVQIQSECCEMICLNLQPYTLSYLRLIPCMLKTLLVNDPILSSFSARPYNWTVFYRHFGFSLCNFVELLINVAFIAC